MRVLVGCEFSGVVRDAFLRAGHDAVSCDLLPTASPGPHIQGDVLAVLEDGWDLAIFFPPCTHLSVSGARWFKDKQDEQAAALEFVRRLMAAPIPRIAIENPVGVISSRIRKPDQIVQPFMFGDPIAKTTCLWLTGLPLLQQTLVVAPGPRRSYKSGRSIPAWYSDLPNTPDRGLRRSTTFPGIAAAMADQWSK